MATRCQCIANKAFPRHRPVRIWSRNFTNSSNYAEEPSPRRFLSRAQVQRESADEIQRLAQSRQQQSGGTFMRSVTLTPTSSEDSELPTLPPSKLQRGRHNTTSFSRPDRGFQTGQNRRFGPRTSSPSDRSSQDSAPRRQRQPRTIENNGDGAIVPRRNKQEDDYLIDLDSGGDAMTTEEHDAYLKKLGYVKKEPIITYPGPTLDMASLMLNYAPRHFGATEPASGRYPSLTDTGSRGLLKDIVKQVRKNETYTEKNIEQLVKKLGPAMPAA